MSTDRKMLSVSEFAKKAGISRQRVYSLLDKKLSTYCQRVDSKIMLDSSALSLFADNGSIDNLTGAVDTLHSQITKLKEHLENLQREAVDKGG